MKFVTEGFADFVNGLKENVTCGEDFATGENIIPDKHKVNMLLPLEDAIVQRVGYCKDHSTFVIIVIIRTWLSLDGDVLYMVFLTVPPDIHITKMKS